MKKSMIWLRQRVKERYPYLIILIFFWLVVIAINDPFDIEKGNYYLEDRGGRAGTTTLGDLTAGTSVKQKFKATENDMNGVELFFATYGTRDNNSTYVLTILDKKGDIVFENRINGNEISDNSFYSLSFDNVDNSKGEEYTISIESVDALNDNCISLWINENSDESSVSLDGKQINGSLVFKVNYYRSYQILKIILWSLIVLLSLVFTLSFEGANEKGFLQIAFILGVFVLLFNPFVHRIDESTHFFRSFCISQGDFYDSKLGEQIGADVPDNYPEIVERELNIKTLIENPDNWFQKFSTHSEFYSNPYMSSVVPVNHAVAAIGILIGRVLSLNALGVILLGRLVNYLFYVCICYFAIKNMKYYKTIFFIIASLPMSIWLAASYSADPVLLATSLLFISICLKYKFSNEYIQIERKDIIILFLCGISITSVKYLIYTPILLFFFFIPRKLFKKGEYKRLILFAVLLVICMALWQLYMLKAFPFTEDRNGYVNVGEQIKFILVHIPYTISNFTNYFSNNLLNHLEGFHYETGILEVGKIAGLMLVVCAFLEKRKYKFESKKEKILLAIVCLGIFIISYGLTIVALYAGFTPVGLKDVQGLQTRYWLPILFPLMLVISMLPIKNNLVNYEKYVGFFMGLGIVNTLSGILLKIFI